MDTSSYFGSTSITYNVYVSSVSDPDEISWTDDRGNSGRFQLYGNSYPLSYGVIATFSNLTGHTGDENWTFSITKTDGGILNVSEQVNIGGNFFATQNKNSSTFIGSGVEVLGNISSAFFVGNGAGFNATGADFSNFIGYGTGSNATGAYNSNFIGYLAGIDATYAYNSNFFGNYAGGSSANAYDANFLGSYAGYSINDGAYSNFFGTNAGYKAGDVNRSNFFGYNAGTNANGSSNANFFGVSAGGGAINAFQSNFIGENAGSLSNGASNSNFFGYNAGAGDKFPVNSSNANFIGTEAGFNADQTSFSNFVGYRAGQQARNATLSTFIGYNSGGQATNASSSIFIGNNAGYTDSVDNYNTGGWSILIGDNTNTNGFSGSIALGANAVNTAPNQFMLADTITQARLGGVEYAFPLTQANPGDVLTNDGAGNLTWAPGGGGGSAWSLLGNAGTDPKTNFIGTTDDASFVMRTNNIERARILSNGNFGVNTDNPNATFEVKGGDKPNGGSIGPTTFDGKPGDDLDDAVIGGTYTGIDNCRILVQFGPGSTAPGNGFSNDIFSWKYTSGPCVGEGGPTEVTPGSPQDLVDGITVTFASGTGHTAKTGWSADVIYGPLPAPDVFSIISSGSNNFFKIKSDGVWNVNDVLYSMPTMQASNPGDVLTNDGSGNLVWAAPGALTVNVTNGLQFVGGDIGLGGTLVQNAEINGNTNSYNLSFNELDRFTVSKANVINLDAYERVGISSEALINISAKNALTLNATSGSLYIKTNSVNSSLATAGQVLTLVDPLTGETEWQNASGGGAGLQWYAENASAPTTAPVATGIGSIALGDNAEALDFDMFVYGKFAGLGATHATSSIFIGGGAGSLAVDSSNSVFIGNGAGTNATSAYNSNFVGAAAGYGATNAVRSNFIGQSAGENATDASNSNFFGLGAGSAATNALRSNFFGMNAGASATNAANSIFLGTNAGANDTVDNTAIYDDASTFADTSILIGHKTSTGGFSNSIALGAYATNTGPDQLQIGSSNRPLSSIFIGDSKGTASKTFTFFAGYRAALNATTATYSTFIGRDAGNGATSASNSNFFGRSAGGSATNARDSNFFGTNAGVSATSARYSNFFGTSAGVSAINAENSNFFGRSAGQNATNAGHSNFFGSGAGNSATGASFSNFFGEQAGFSATDASESNFFGRLAGYGATDATFSNFFGNSAGNGATAAYNSNFLGQSAGLNATSAFEANFIGTAAGNGANQAFYSNFFGTGAGQNALYANTSNFFGPSAGGSATNANYSNFIGTTSGYQAANASNSNFFGYSTGTQATNAHDSTFIGYNAGFQATNAANSIFIGRRAGQNDTVNNTASYDDGITFADTSILIGHKTLTGGFSNSIALGAYATNTATNQFMIGSTNRPIDTTRINGSASTQCTITTGTGIACTSDERLKTNITDLTTDTLDKLLSVKTVTYNWLQNPTSKTQIGFLAQDLEQYFPELVETDRAGMKSVYYAQMTPILVEAIREMNLKILDFSDITKENTWRDAIGSWLGNASNKITRIFTGELCLYDENGQTECINASQLRELKQSLGNTTQPIPPVTPPTTPDVNSTPTPDPLTCTAPQVLNQTGDACIDPVTETPPTEISPSGGEEGLQ